MRYVLLALICAFALTGPGFVSQAHACNGKKGKKACKMKKGAKCDHEKKEKKEDAPENKD